MLKFFSSLNVIMCNSYKNEAKTLSEADLLLRIKNRAVSESIVK